jgi:hypothetical protein
MVKTNEREIPKLEFGDFAFRKWLIMIII